MNDLRTIVFILIRLYFFTIIFFIPCVHIIRNLVRMANVKKQRNNLGSIIVEVNDANPGQKGTYVFYGGSIVLVFLLVFASGNPLYFIYIVFFLPALLDLILVKQYSKFNGFYENGIVNGAFIGWEDIFSWKIIDDDKLSFLKKDGFRFDMATKSKQEIIISYMEEKGIEEEK